VRRLWYSPSLRTIVIYGVSGLGFAGANLILARVLPTTEYALFTLVIALTNLGYAVAPIGMDGMVNRHRLEAGPRLLKRTLAAGLFTALVFASIAGFAYHIDTPLLLLVFAATVGGGAMAVAAAQFQSEQRYGVSLALTQSSNIVLIVAAFAVVLTGIMEALLPLAISALGFVLSGFIGWWVLFGERAVKPHRETRFPYGEALSFAGVNSAGLLLVQLDRLIIPQVLTLHELATFGVLAAIAGSLFRVLAMGVGYTLLPRLRAAGTVLERRHLIAHEIKLVVAVVIAGSIAIWFLTPWIERSFLAGKYHLSGSLLLAAIFSGVTKIMNSLSRAGAVALATASELSVLNWLGWVSVAVALLAGLIGARWGLAGLMYGVGLGWLMRALTASYLTLRHLRLPESIPAAVR
jgi:O-antigen/teichoic acid export membrane protein